MEVTLLGADGVPANALLSLKVGETKRQGSVTKIGQPFRFPSSPAEPLPLKAELLIPAAPAQTVNLDPLQEALTIDFGNNYKVQLHLRAARELEPAPAKLGSALEAKGAPAEKLQMAQAAAAYLEEHDLVRLFQSMLHSLLIAKPADPYSFVEERIARAKKLATVQSQVEKLEAEAESLPVLPSRPAPEAVPASAPTTVCKAAPKYDFEGRWVQSKVTSGPSYENKVAIIDGTQIKWDDFVTDPTPIVPLGPMIFSMELEGQTHKAELREDGKLLVWSDGEEWSREGAAMEFKCRGRWTQSKVSPSGPSYPDKVVVIHGNYIEWDSAFAIQRSPITVVSETVFSLELYGETFRAELKENEIIWSDGEEWSRLKEAGVERDVSAGPVVRAKSRVRHSTNRHRDKCSKVEVLMLTLQSAKDDMSIVLPFLPEALRAMLDGEELKNDCAVQFSTLDFHNKGVLDPTDLLPVICELSQETQITLADCRRFVDMFDANEDGVISREEFYALVRFVIMAGYLESEEGRKLVEEAMLQENAFQDFIQMITADMERLWSIIPFLPEWLVDHITSESFMDESAKHFQELDKNNSGTLEATELVSVVQILCEANPLSIDVSKCQQFISLFDTTGKGYIEKDEFIDFAQFLTVMNFLTTTTEGQEISKRADLESSAEKTLRYIAMLETDPNAVSEVLRHMQPALVRCLNSTTFEQDCARAFEAAATGKAEVHLDQLIPTLRSLCTAITDDQVKRFGELGGGLTVTAEEFSTRARYIILMVYLELIKDQQDTLLADILLGEEKVAQLLQLLKDGAGRISELISFLPEEFTDELSSDEFKELCIREFNELDKDKSGALEPAELMPLLQNLTEAKRLALSQEHCRRFLSIFDQDHDGTITIKEFLNYAQFMMVIAYFEAMGESSG